MGPEGDSVDLEGRLDALYAADPEGFVAARKRLASELRAAGRREEARRVAALRRPTRAAWALNRVALGHRDRIEALVVAGERLRRAHEELLAGGDPRAVQRASEERRAVITALADEALGILSAPGRATEPHREEVEATLEAASADSTVGELLRQGRLATPVPRPSGFLEVLDDALPAGSPGSPAASAETTREAHNRAEAAPEHPGQAERARQEVVRLRQLATEAAADADRAAAALEDAVARLERLEEELAEARARATAARDEAMRARAREEDAHKAAAVAEARLRAGRG